jgi:hypothetical protein
MIASLFHSDSKAALVLSGSWLICLLGTITGAWLFSSIGVENFRIGEVGGEEGGE